MYFSSIKYGMAESEWRGRRKMSRVSFFRLSFFSSFCFFSSWSSHSPTSELLSLSLPLPSFSVFSCLEPFPTFLLFSFFHFSFFLSLSFLRFLFLFPDFLSLTSFHLFFQNCSLTVLCHSHSVARVYKLLLPFLFRYFERCNFDRKEKRRKRNVLYDVNIRDLDYFNSNISSHSDSEESHRKKIRERGIVGFSPLPLLILLSLSLKWEREIFFFLCSFWMLVFTTWSSTHWLQWYQLQLCTHCKWPVVVVQSMFNVSYFNGR